MRRLSAFVVATAVIAALMPGAAHASTTGAIALELTCLLPHFPTTVTDSADCTGAAVGTISGVDDADTPYTVVIPMGAASTTVDYADTCSLGEQVEDDGQGTFTITGGTATRGGGTPTPVEVKVKFNWKWVKLIAHIAVVAVAVIFPSPVTAAAIGVVDGLLAMIPEGVPPPNCPDPGPPLTVVATGVIALVA